MRVIKNKVIIDIKKEDFYLLVNGLNGAMDLINDSEKKQICQWDKHIECDALDEDQMQLYQKLLGRGYIMTASDESERRDMIIDMLRKCENRDANGRNIWFVLTYNCNFSCPYCYEKQIRESGTMTKPMVDTIFELNPNPEMIGFFGGEPLLLENHDIIKYIISKAPSNTRYCIITNGFYLEEYFDLLKNVDVQYIQVTLDGTQDNHNKTRFIHQNEDTYVKIMKGIEKYAKNNIPIHVRMNVNSGNIDDCIRQKEKMKGESWGEKLFFEMQPIFQLSERARNELYQRMIEDDMVNNNDNLILRKMLPIANALHTNSGLHPIIKACDESGQTRYYDPKGNIYNCILAVGQEKKSIGKYYPVVSMKNRSFLTRDISTIKECRDCTLALFCGGGCPNGLDASMDVYTPNCSEIRNTIIHLIPNLLREKMSDE